MSESKWLDFHRKTYERKLIDIQIAEHVLHDPMDNQAAASSFLVGLSWLTDAEADLLLKILEAAK